MNTQRLTLDLDKSSVPRGRVTIAQCDHDGTTVEAEIYDNGIALNTSGLSAYLVMRLPDGRHYYRVPATLDGHVATALVDEAYAATATGTTEIAYFELVGSGGVVYSTSRFGVRVLPSATADATVPETWDGEVERLIQQLDEMAESSRVIIDDLTTLEEIVGAAEQGRVSAESGRVSAETARANAETARANAEQGRVTAEQSRVTAESSRASEFSTLKAESQAATSVANTATNAANSAATAANTAANAANAAAANADATADGVESRVQEMAQDAAETATADAEQRIQDAIDAMGDISELAVPLMSADVRGGARLEENGGLVLRDEKLGIGSLVQESDGYTRGGLAEVTAEGHAEQFSTTGKNLFNLAALVGAVWKCTAVVHADGSMTMTATESAEIWVGNTSTTAGTSWDTAILGEPIPVTAGSTYTISCVGDVHASRVFGTWLDANKQSISYENFLSGYGSNPTTVKTITVPSGAVYLGMRVGIALEYVTAGNTYLARVQLELGSTATSYEPYTGGAPSPSPDYPQEIQVVRGRNLVIKEVDGIAISSYNDGIIVNASSAKSYIAEVEQGETYTLSVVTKGNRFSIAGVSNDSPQENDSCTLVYVGSGSEFKYTFTAPNTPYVIATLTNGGDTPTGVQLTLGSTPQPYVPYGHVGMEVQGKNLIQGLSNGAYDGHSGIFVNAAKYKNTNMMSCNPSGHYAITFNNWTPLTIQVLFWRSDGSFLSSITGTYQTKQFTVPDGAYSMRLNLEDVSSQNNIPQDAIQVVLGSVPIPYEPYHHTTTPIPLPSRGWVGSLPDGTADVLTLDGAGKVTWELETWKKTISDLELSTSESLPQGRIYAANIEPAPIRPNTWKDMSSMWCTHFRPSSPRDTDIAYDTYKPYNASIMNDFDNFAFATQGIGNSTSEVLTWFSANPITVLYPLATPVTEDCGYIDLPSIDGECQISIPELDALGVRYFVDDSAGTLARQWYKRAQSEYETRLSTLEAIVAELV